MTFICLLSCRKIDSDKETERVEGVTSLVREERESRRYLFIVIGWFCYYG